MVAIYTDVSECVSCNFFSFLMTSQRTFRLGSGAHELILRRADVGQRLTLSIDLPF